MIKNTFACLLGIDGSGKTSIINQAKKYINFNTASWKDFYRNLSGITKLFPPEDSTEKLNAMSPQLRSSCLATLISLFYDFGIKPYSDKLIVADSYYFKFYAKEKIYRKTENWFFSAMEALEPPSLVIYLDIDPNSAYLRKKNNIQRYEYLHSPKDFIDFQSEIAEIMLKEAGRRSKIVKINATEKNTKELTKEFISILEKKGG